MLRLVSSLALAALATLHVTVHGAGEAAAQNTSFLLINGTAYPISTLEVSESLMNIWTKNELGAPPIKAGERVVRERFGVDPDTCTGDHSCIRLSGCPSLTIKDNPDPLRTDPIAGTYVDTGTAIALVVSSGKIAVPDVVNMTESDARNALLDMQFFVDVVYVVDDTVAPGTVLTQTPKAGKSMPVGTVVTLEVSQLTVDPTDTSANPNP
mgnify:CR=1 FL=1